MVFGEIQFQLVCALIRFNSITDATEVLRSIDVIHAGF